jgi:RIO kinase 2
LDIIVALAEFGLIHGDFNEFNLLVVEQENGDEIEVDVVVIDFPQMVSTNHENADFYFDRDVECIHEFFGKRFAASIDFRPKLSDIEKKNDLDVEVEASGFSKEMAKEFDRLYQEETKLEELVDQDYEDQFDESKVESQSTEDVSDEIEQVEEAVKDLEEDNVSVSSARTTTTRSMRSIKPIDEEEIKRKVKNAILKRQQPNVMRLAKTNAQKSRNADVRRVKQEMKEINNAKALYT